MADTHYEPRGFAVDCWIETAEGPVIMHETPGKGFAAMTRMSDGRLGFRQLMKVVKTGAIGGGAGPTTISRCSQPEQWTRTSWRYRVAWA